MTNIKTNNNGFRVEIKANKKVYYAMRHLPTLIDTRGGEVKIAYVPVVSSYLGNADYVPYMAMLVKIENNRYVRVNNRADFCCYKNSKEVDSFWEKTNYGSYILPKWVDDVETIQLF